MTKRLAIAFFYDAAGIVDEYYIHLIEALKPYVDHTILVSNGPLSKNSENNIRPVVEDLIVRKNVGFDVWAYKSALEQFGWDRLKEYDEVIFYNHTFYGPIFPFSEMFSAMDKRNCDFWGISAHRAISPNPFGDELGELPFHLNSHFIVVRREMHQSPAFKRYWTDMGRIESYIDSILLHETRFTRHFQQLGFVCSVYLDPDEYHTPYPVFMEIDRTLENRSPILKKRLFFHDTLFLEGEAIDLPRALTIVEKESDYDLSLIWKSIGRVATPRTLNNNAALLSIFPDVAVSHSHRRSTLKVAVCAHVYYTDMLDEILSHAANITTGYDLIITTDSAAKKEEIESLAAGKVDVSNLTVLVVNSNDGRDTSALLITCRDLFMDDRYDLVCRIHTKKSPQDGAKGLLFKRHMFENLLGSPGYVDNILDLFAENEQLGLAFPALVHIGYPTMGHSWFSNKDNVAKLAVDLELAVPLDDNTPVAPNGGMYWFRPKALYKLFVYPWTWDDFADQNYEDGSLPHAIERIIAYVAIDSGYLVRHVLTSRQAAHNYVMLEAKLQKVLSTIPGADFRTQMGYLGATNVGVRESFRRFVRSVKIALLRRSPLLSKMLRPVYKFFRTATRLPKLILPK